MSSRQSMIKSRKQDGQGARETRAFVALQNRKISRRNDVEKKRGIPLMEISRNENEAQNCQDQSKTTEKGIKFELYILVLSKQTADCLFVYYI